jgi:hypothetical protein
MGGTQGRGGSISKQRTVRGMVPASTPVRVRKENSARPTGTDTPTACWEDPTARPWGLGSQTSYQRSCRAETWPSRTHSSECTVPRVPPRTSRDDQSIRLTPDDLEELVAVLSREAPEMQRQIAYEDQYGGGVSWHEVLRIWLPNAEFIKNTICTTLITISIESMCQRFKRKHSSHPQRASLCMIARLARIGFVYYI